MTETIIGKEFAAKVIPLIKLAKKSIDIIVYDWNWYPNQVGSEIQKFNNAIINATKKNIRVRVIIKSSETIKILGENKVQTKQWLSSKNLHTKLMIIDDEVAIIGSHNYTMNAFQVNYEASIILQNGGNVKTLSDYFKNLWS